MGRMLSDWSWMTWWQGAAAHGRSLLRFPVGGFVIGLVVLCDIFLGLTGQYSINSGFQHIRKGRIE